MKDSPTTSGRISDHTHGLGTVTNEMVTQRAKELAVINGRDRAKFTEADWQQARRELSGQQLFDDRQTEEPVEGLTEWDEKPDVLEHRVKNSPPSDEQTVAEHLTREGLEEAAHEQMLEGSREQKNQL